MLILGIETSCDETSAAIIKADKNDTKTTLLSNIVATSLSLHTKTGGIIPEIAAREQIKYIIPVISEALAKANIKLSSVDTIAVTVGPGLIGSLLVGVETAKTFSFILNKPITAVNHLFGHIYANFIKEENIEEKEIQFPSLALIVSGGHTDLVLIKQHRETEWLGGTRDDASGEALDKIGRLLNLPYPAGPIIENLAKKGNSNKYNFPRPLISSDDFDFSFSGLKTAVLRQVNTMQKLNDQDIENICASFQKAIIDTLVTKTLKAARKYSVKSILLGGGVAANQTLKENLKFLISSQIPDVNLFVPNKSLCTDNAAMIATAGFFNYQKLPWQNVEANPELYFT